MIILNPESDTPLYKQLSTQIIESIVRGDLSSGDSLPSVRAFAGDLGVNMHTVNKSYHELESKGIIRIVPKKGAIIIANKNNSASEQQTDAFSDELRPLIAEALVNGMNEKEMHHLVTDLIHKIKEE